MSERMQNYQLTVWNNPVAAEVTKDDQFDDNVQLREERGVCETE